MFTLPYFLFLVSLAVSKCQAFDRLRRKTFPREHKNVAKNRYFALLFFNETDTVVSMWKGTVNAMLFIFLLTVLSE